MKVLFLSLGNIPSTWAHSLQIMKMSEALNQVFDDFTLICGKGFKEKKISLPFLWDFYGIEKPFDLWQIPISEEGFSGIFGFAHERGDASYLAKIAKQSEADLVFTRDISVAWNCLSENIGVVLELHSVPFIEQAPMEVARFARHPKLIGVLTLTHHLKECYVSMGIPREKILVLLSGYTTPLGKIKKEVSKTPTVVYMGSITYHKGADFFIPLAKELPHIQFQVIGGVSEENKECQQKCEEEKCTNLEYRNRVSIRELSNLLKRADFCLLPNRPDHPVSKVSFPLKLMDYLASAVPTIVSLTPCLMSSVIEHRTHVMMSHYTPQDFAQTLQEVIKDPVLYRTLSKNGRNLSKNYSWVQRVKNIKNYYVL